MKIAVWMTNYNSERHIGKAIESVLKQTHQDLILYVFDNHSTDRAPAIIQEYALRDENDERIIIPEVPEGLAGIPLMDYAWQWMDDEGQDATIHIGGHDYWHERTLERLVQRLNAHPAAAIVYSDTYIVDEAGNVCHRYPDIINFQGRQALPQIPLPAIFGVDSPHLFGLWRESVRREIPIRHHCSGWDHLLVAEAALHGHILYEPNAALFMRAIARDDSSQKYGQRHLSKDTLGSKSLDFKRQLEWMMHIVDESMQAVPEPVRQIYRMIYRNAMIAGYLGLRGGNLGIVPGAFEEWSADGNVQQIYAAMAHIEKHSRMLLENVKPVPKPV